MIALRPWWPRLSAVGSGVAVVSFLSTLSFLFTTPGIGDPAAAGRPVPPVAGGWLVLDTFAVHRGRAGHRRGSRRACHGQATRDPCRCTRPGRRGIPTDA
uniref:DUF417 family protein n=1 Tax=Amycolatopsis acidiphila TaxID=715473 RepID=UPI003898E06E